MRNWIRPLFIVAGLYDGSLGLVFLFFGPQIFQAYGVTPPNHWGYVQFPALLLVVFAIMFFRIAADPVRNRELIWYGVGLKLAYCGTVFYYQVVTGIPPMWMPWAWADLAFLIVFLIAWKSLAATPATENVVRP
jgi:hypothetical protein